VPWLVFELQVKVLVLSEVSSGANDCLRDRVLGRPSTLEKSADAVVVVHESHFDSWVQFADGSIRARELREVCAQAVECFLDCAIGFEAGDRVPAEELIDRTGNLSNDLRLSGFFVPHPDDHHADSTEAVAIREGIHARLQNDTPRPSRMSSASS
jgi:hypothetical protein